ncbi:hypothetical protein I79_020723 [Cricetulus griseus]|uniref:Uncharacterized protein n=1 Tax=Cricetulus griseus TaxID=10029 RepID=G3IAU1_CRIGR|nr:hypothetical protein I79_020723 [Cricetulus griseus]
MLQMIVKLKLILITSMMEFKANFKKRQARSCMKIPKPPLPKPFNKIPSLFKYIVTHKAQDFQMCVL